MQYTPNYNMLLPEGSDVVNPLVDVNPNFSSLDTIIKSISNRAVDRATCTKTGTTHSVVRSNTSAPVFNFTSTGDWETGDTMVVDGTPVTVFLPDGSAPLTGAYIINTEVVAIINGTRVTLLTGGRSVTSIDASDVTYDNTSSGLSANDAQDAFDEIAAMIGNLSDLDTTDKSNIVNAINEVLSGIAVAGEVYVLTESTRGSYSDLTIVKNGLTVATLTSASPSLRYRDALVYIYFDTTWKMEAQTNCTADGVAFSSGDVILNIGTTTGQTKSARIIATP